MGGSGTCKNVEPSSISPMIRSWMLSKRSTASLKAPNPATLRWSMDMLSKGTFRPRRSQSF